MNHQEDYFHYRDMLQQLIGTMKPSMEGHAPNQSLLVDSIITTVTVDPIGSNILSRLSLVTVIQVVVV